MSKEFTEAAASYFGIDPARLADSTLTSNAEGLTLHLKIRLTDDDMIGIGKRMEERRKPVRTVNGYAHPALDMTSEQRASYMRLSAGERMDILATWYRLTDLDMVKYSSYGDFVVCQIMQNRELMPKKVLDPDMPFIPKPGETMDEARARYGLPPIKVWKEHESVLAKLSAQSMAEQASAPPPTKGHP